MLEIRTRMLEIRTRARALPPPAPQACRHQVEAVMTKLVSVAPRLLVSVGNLVPVAAEDGARAPAPASVRAQAQAPTLWAPETG